MSRSEVTRIVIDKRFERMIPCLQKSGFVITRSDFPKSEDPPKPPVFGGSARARTRLTFLQSEEDKVSPGIVGCMEPRLKVEYVVMNQARERFISENGVAVSEKLKESLDALARFTRA